MGKPTGNQMADKAIQLLNGEIIYYNEAAMKKAGDSGKVCADCQGFMELIAKQCGANMSYAGSNDMFRHACTWVGTLAEAKQLGYLQRGCALFILEQNGAEPAKYRSDGIGNASHVGMYIGEKAYEDKEKNRWCNVAHSSSSRGKVCGSTLKNAWTHVGLWKCADFSVDSTSSGQSVSQTEGGDILTAIVRASSGSSVNFRQAAKSSAPLCSRHPTILIGDCVDVIEQGDEWTKVSYDGETGWMMTKFLDMSGENTVTDTGVSSSGAAETISQIRTLLNQLEAQL